MPRRAVLFLLTLLLLPLSAPASAADGNALFEAAFAAWLSPAQEALQSGAYALRVGDSAYVPTVAPEITPFDREMILPSVEGFSFTSSDPQVVAVSDTGLMTGVQNGTATVACTAANGAQTAFKVTVSADAMPERVKAFVYVARREYLENQRQRLPRANEYTKWYYRSNKEVGWCSVFTIWCANASGTEPIPEEDAVNVQDTQTLFLREGQVGNQYDGFQALGRFTGIPRPGYLVIYANMKNAYLVTHIGVVTEVSALPGGLFRVTTVEGNMSNTVKCYTYLYDSKKSNHLLTAETRDGLQENMSALPAEAQTDPLTQYELSTDSWTVFGFCATWL